MTISVGVDQVVTLDKPITLPVPCSWHKGVPERRENAGEKRSEGTEEA